LKLPRFRPASNGKCAVEYATANKVKFMNLRLKGISINPATLVLVSYVVFCSQASGQGGTNAPSITPGAIVPIFSNVNTIQPGEWVSIFGTNLASSTAIWSGTFTTTLGGASVTINGKSGFLIYASPTQINLQAPIDSTTGPVPVVVTTTGGNASATVTLAQFGPSFSLFDATHVAGIILRTDGSGTQGGGTYDLLGPTGNSLSYPTVAAKPGDTVEIFGVGFGATIPALTAGQVFSGAAPTVNPVNLLINGVQVTPLFVGLSSAGLYQINLTIPPGLGAGDLSLVAGVGGVQTPAGTVISLATPVSAAR
jgi:uncharacterized protein (TIGR03437 family)